MGKLSYTQFDLFPLLVYVIWPFNIQINIITNWRNNNNKKTSYFILFFVCGQSAVEFEIVPTRSIKKPTKNGRRQIEPRNSISAPFTSLSSSLTLTLA